MAIKPKTQAMADALIADPGISQTDAYLITHPDASKATARAAASSLLAKPEVMQYMAKKSDVAEKAIIDVMKNAKKNKDSVQWQRLTLDSASQILDRVYGKPITRNNNTNLDVSLEDLLSNLQ